MNKLRSRRLSSLFLGVALGLGAIAGCDGSSNVGRIQDDATNFIKISRTRVELLQRRADLLLQRGRSLTAALPGIADAGRVLGEAKGRIDQLRGTLDAGPPSIQAAAKTGKPEALLKLNDELREKVEHGLVESAAELDAVESWLATAELSLTPKAPAAGAVPPPAAPTKPAPPSAGSGAQPAARAGSAPPK